MGKIGKVNIGGLKAKIGKIGRGKIGAGVGALAAKIGAKILSMFIKLAKVLKIGKVGLAAGSALSYAYLFTWQFALMIMVLLFVHESGHVWAMKKCGLKTKGIYFIPFLGAAAVSEEMFKTRRDEAYVAIMGPIWGFILSGIAGIIYIVTKDALFAAAAGWMAMVNLFNLLPINPLDGGRIIKSITFSINSKLGYSFLLIGITASIILTFWAGIFLFFVLLIIACLEFIYEYRKKNENLIIKKCIKELDKIADSHPVDRMKDATNGVKNILSNEKEDPLTRIKKVISIGNDINDVKLKTQYDYDITILSHILLPHLEMCDYTPKMNTRGVIATVVAYIIIAVVLWGLMTYMNHIPEVEIARKFFMS